MPSGTISARPLLVFGVAGLAAFAIDRLTKAWAQAALGADDAVRWIVDGVFGFDLTLNYGASFSMGTSVTWLFALIGLVAVLAIPAFVKQGKAAWAISLGLVWGGALGNLADRLFTGAFGRGPVIDFLVYGDFFIGNVADIFLAVGACLLIILVLLGKAPIGKETHA